MGAVLERSAKLSCVDGKTERVLGNTANIDVGILLDRRAATKSTIKKRNEEQQLFTNFPSLSQKKVVKDQICRRPQACERMKHCFCTHMFLLWLALVRIGS